MPHFPIAPGHKEGQVVPLPKDQAHHVREVLRMKAGGKIRLFDGEGGRYLARIESLSDREVIAKIVEKMPAEMSKGTLTLGQALLKREKMETVIQKAAELGVSSFHPFTSSRTIAKFGTEAKADRWRKISEEASKQCGRGSLMKVGFPVPFDNLLVNANADLKLIFWEEGGKPVREFFKKSVSARTTLVLIGPEGGFSGEEIEAAKRSGFVCLSLGPRILRAETAAIAAMTLIQYELENF